MNASLLRPSVLARELVGLGVTHAVGIPDDASAALLRRLDAEGRIRVLRFGRGPGLAEECLRPSLAESARLLRGALAR